MSVRRQLVELCSCYMFTGNLLWCNKGHFFLFRWMNFFLDALTSTQQVSNWHIASAFSRIWSGATNEDETKQYQKIMLMWFGYVMAAHLLLIALLLSASMMYGLWLICCFRAKFWYNSCLNLIWNITHAFHALIISICNSSLQ